MKLHHPKMSKLWDLGGWTKRKKNINICERVENKRAGFTAQQIMYDVLEYAKVPVTIQYYYKAQSYVKATRKNYDPNDKRISQSHDSAATTSSTSKEVSGLKTNDDGTFTLDGKCYLL